MTKNNHNIPEDYNKTVAAHKSAEKPAVLAGDTSKGKPKTSTAKRLRISKKSLMSSSILIVLVAVLVIGSVATYLYSQRNKNEVSEINFTSYEAYQPTKEQMDYAVTHKGSGGTVVSVSSSAITLNESGTSVSYSLNSSSKVYKGLAYVESSLNEIKPGMFVTVGYVIDNGAQLVEEVWYE